MDKNLKWKFNSVSEKAKETAGAAVALAVFIGGISTIFHPIAVMLSLAYATGTLIQGEILMKFPKFRDKALSKFLKSGMAKELPKDHDLLKRIKKVSNRLNQKDMPRVLIVNADFVGKMAAPPIIRKLFRKSIEENMHRVFGVAPNSNIFITTEEGLKSTKNKKDELDFIVAHEMSHIKTDKFAPARFAQTILKKSSRFLVLAVAATVAASAVGGAIPLISTSIFSAVGSLFIATTAAGVAWKYGSRIAEYRADRNAMHLTKNLDGAVGCMNMISNFNERDMSGFQNIFSTHPIYKYRVTALHDSFNKVTMHDAKVKFAQKINKASCASPKI